MRSERIVPSSRRRPIEVLILATKGGKTTTMGPRARTLSQVIRAIGDHEPDLATLWVGREKGPLAPKAFADLVEQMLVQAFTLKGAE